MESTKKFEELKKLETKNNEISPEEDKKIDLMRSSLTVLQEQEDNNISVKEVGDDLMLRRFLRARDGDVEKATSMFVKYLSWRKSFVPNGSISASEVAKDLNQNKMFMQGFDKQGRPITVGLAGRHFHLKGGIEDYKRYVVYFLDKVISRMPSGQEKFVFIGDLDGWGYANIDIRACLGALTVLQDFYPERLGKLFIVNAPYIFMMVWKMITPFIDNNTKKKIIFVEKKDIKATLLEDIEENQLPDVYGGKLSLVSIQDA
ncbi:phosphatidylinositol transfer protein 3-like [Impatiens glandulifera]|uniref:phosphatidylinositol transfer protein 3-like n=1 Tax=Impatiens glandulifera TaxID=253017 RepID=UPI001FB051C1|nr:phosphatidylinositol transfer protein 3-like [Impatiens glandulifera]